MHGAPTPMNRTENLHRRVTETTEIDNVYEIKIIIRRHFIPLSVAIITSHQFHRITTPNEIKRQSKIWNTKDLHDAGLRGRLP